MMIDIRISCFGVFKKFGQTQFDLQVQSPATPQVIKAELIKIFTAQTPSFAQNGAQLVLDSALANETDILNSDALIQHSCQMALLPPVCGG